MFNTIRHLLPNAKAWSVTIDKQLRRYMQGLGNAADSTRLYIDLVWLDIFPATTRELDQWEDQWGLPNTLTIEQERRDRLAATWRALGGQSPRYLQDTLQAAGFDVYIHEWWTPGTTTPRVPTDYLNDGTLDIKYQSADGVATMQDGDALAQDGSTLNPSGYVLVNKQLIPSLNIINDGSFEMCDGGINAQDGGTLYAYKQKQYVIPVDPTKYPYFLYIGGQVFPNKATIDQSRRNEFETLCLKICPAQQWLGILVNYT